jgi:hypothetical protein
MLSNRKIFVDGVHHSFLNLTISIPFFCSTLVYQRNDAIVKKPYLLEVQFLFNSLFFLFIFVSDSEVLWSSHCSCHSSVQ